jgi:hypothetical protein
MKTVQPKDCEPLFALIRKIRGQENTPVLAGVRVK